MRKLSLFAGLAILAGVACMPPKVIAQTEPSQTQQSPDNQASPRTEPERSNAASDEDMQAFSGQIVRTHGKYVLNDMETKTTYQLDDQAKAEDYQGRQVRITGTLDSRTKTIRVQMIRTANGQ